VTLLLKGIQFPLVPSKSRNLKLLWGAGTLAGATVGAAAAIPSATRQVMSRAVSLGGGTTAASEMDSRGWLLDNGCPVLVLVLEDTMVPAADGVEEVPSVPWSRESIRTATECVGVAGHLAWESPTTKVWS
jgi:hypothetical protein